MRSPQPARSPERAARRRFGVFHDVHISRDGPSDVNVATAGSAIPVKFSLNGNQGLDIFAPGLPCLGSILCGTSDSTDAVKATVTAGGSGLRYDPTSDQYIYAWKTDKAWKGTCRQLTVKLNDGSIHIAFFRFQ